MPVDGRIPLALDLPNVSERYNRGLLTGAQMSEQPLRNAMLDARTDNIQTSTAVTEQDMGMRTRAEEQNEVYRSSAYMLSSLAQLKTIQDPQERMTALQDINDRGQAMGLQLGDIPAEFIPNDQNIDQMMAGLEGVVRGNGQGKPSRQREFEGMMENAGIERGTKDWNEAARVWANLAPKAGTRSAKERAATDEPLGAAIVRQGADEAGAVTTAQNVADLATKPQVAEKVAVATAAGKGVGERRNLRIEYGLEAAKSMPIAKRGIQLLKTIETGGVDAISLAVKRRLGMETADEGELANSLAKAVLQQYRATFGAQFTENEGNKLDSIEAGLSKSTEANIRLLERAYQMSEKYSNQAIEDALENKDYRTAATIQEDMAFEFDEDYQMFGESEGYQQGDRAVDADGNALIFNNGEWEDE